MFSGQLKAAFAIAFFAAIDIFAQARPAFDAASVKLQDPSIPRTGSQKHGGPGIDDSGRVTYDHLTMRDLLAEAYGISWDQIVGPGWATDATGDSGAFAITATMPNDTTVVQFQLMLRNLLADRFHLTVHHESKSFPGYELTVASGGFKLKESPEDNAVPARPGSPRDVNGFPLRNPGAMSSGTSPRMGKWGTILSSNRMSMPQFAQRLGEMINESNGVALNASIPRVVDKTGLNGVYEFTLSFWGIAILPALLPVDFAPRAPEPGEIGPSLFTALETQLGLKLTKMKDVPVDMLIVDHVDKVPTGN